MRPRYFPAFLLSLAGAASAADQCIEKSGIERLPVVELFTSEGCSSCPPADRWLSSLKARATAPRQITALAYHVDYWDYIGWKDRFAIAEHGHRHQRLVDRSGGRVRYTPHVFVNGIDYPAWREDRIPLEAAPASVRIEARTEGESVRRWRIFVSGKDAPERSLVLTLALTEDGLASRVTAGENRGDYLRHDFVVRTVQDFELNGPDFDVSAALELPRDADPRQSRASVVLRSQKGELLQSLSIGLCQ